MTRDFLKNIFPYALVFSLISYLLYGTGLHSDDYSEIHAMQDLSMADFYFSQPQDLGIFLFGLPTYYFLFWMFPFAGHEYLFAYDIIKILVNFTCFLGICFFFKDYMPRLSAIFCAFLFIFFPLHDATNYWYMCMGYLISPALLMFGHRLIRNNQYYSGFFLTLIGAFSFYVSPPFIFGLSIIFLAEKKLKKFFIYLIPGLIYCTYYFLVKSFVIGAERRIDDALSFGQFSKNFILQFASLVDASLGPSAVFKFFHFIQAASLNIIFAIPLIFFAGIKFFNLGSSNPLKFQLNKTLALGLISVALLSLGVYSLTGYYWHTPFNLSNRSLIFISLILSYLITLAVSKNKALFVTFATFFLVVTISISDHWKSWNANQINIINNISTNLELNAIPAGSVLFIDNNLYSKVQSTSYIEFFIMPWTSRAIFSDFVFKDRAVTVIPLSPYLKLDDSILEDQKWNEKYALEDSPLFIYDSLLNRVTELPQKDLAKDLQMRRRNISRHWVQMFSGTWLESLITYFAPNMKYLFTEQ